MKVVLTKDIARLGQKGSILDVKNGFGRNFLINQGFARLAGASDIQVVAQQKTNIMNKQEKRAQMIEDYKDRIPKIKLMFYKKENEKGHLFAGVSGEEVAQALHRQGFREITEEHIFGTPIKTTGEHAIFVELDKIQIPLNINVKSDV